MFGQAVHMISRPLLNTLFMLQGKGVPEETRQARQSVRYRGCRAEFSSLKPSLLVSANACRGKVAVCQEGESAVS